MGLPSFLVDSLGSSVQYPNHTVTGNEEQTGHEASRAFDGRRDSTDYWSPITPNADAYLQIVFDRVRAFNRLSLDRGHNLGGCTVQLLASQDSFGTYETPVSAVVPTVAAAGTPLDNATGVLSEEGAWHIRFPVVAASAVRIFVPAMGADLLPQIVGAWVGLELAPASSTGWGVHLPVSPGGATLQGLEVMSEFGYVGRGVQADRREGELAVKLASVWDYAPMRWHLEAQYGYGRPMWVTLDDAEPERTFLALRPKGRFGFQWARDWYPQTATVPYQEHEPLLS